MKLHLDCIPCFLKQSIEASRMATDNEEVHDKVMKEVLKLLQNINYEKSPPELSREVHRIIRSITKIEDPYKKVKDESNEMIKKIYNQLKEKIKKSADPLLTSIKLAIVGNVIDFGTMNRFNIDDMIKHALKREFDDKDYILFKKVLEKSKNILYLADNSGEIFFDKLLIEELKKNSKNITYVVKQNPIINDVLKIDAEYAEINNLAKIISYDKDQDISSPGIVMDFASKEFKEYFEKSDMIISKGQGNYEGLSSIEKRVFFLLVAKCPLVAKDIRSEVGKLILKVNK